MADQSKVRRIQPTVQVYFDGRAVMGTVTGDHDEYLVTLLFQTSVGEPTPVCECERFQLWGRTDCSHIAALRAHVRQREDTR